ncbi:hypothetical protein AAF712_009346 [Marasmius tenuissimus]|uniref:Uncharacterized protein n=1 Tax=Marasmius tenuissimus TaxID=585030 RepID=A0ABR2ZSG0_9AGAR
MDAHFFENSSDNTFEGNPNFSGVNGSQLNISINVNAPQCRIVIHPSPTSRDSPNLGARPLEHEDDNACDDAILTTSPSIIASRTSSTQIQEGQIMRTEEKQGCFKTLWRKVIQLLKIKRWMSDSQ